MKIKSEFFTRKEGMAYLRKRGWTFCYFNDNHEAVFQADTHFRYIYKIKAGRWAIRVGEA